MNGQKMGSFETNVISLFSIQGPSNGLTMVRLVLDIRIPQKLLSPPICFDLRPAAPPVIQLTSITIQGRSCVLIQVNCPNDHLMHHIMIMIDRVSMSLCNMSQRLRSAMRKWLTYLLFGGKRVQLLAFMMDDGQPNAVVMQFCYVKDIGWTRMEIQPRIRSS